jgi:predicted nucleic acid-binding protein
MTVILHPQKNPFMWIVDSSVWIDYFNGVVTPQTDILNESLGQRELGVGDIILCEVLQGFQLQHEFESARAALMSLPIFTIGGADIAIKSAENYRALRRSGITIRKTIDCLIATFVIEQGFVLLHNDRDFEPFEQYLGLNVLKI